MTRPTLAVYGFGYNLNLIKYPWREMLHSALALADRVYFNACPSEDDFPVRLLEEFSEEMGSGQLQVYAQPWGDHHTVQAHIGNYLLDQIGQDYHFALKLDADEVLHEDSFAEFREDLSQMYYLGYGLGKPNYVHFCPDDKTTFPFIYDSKAVICKTARNFRFDTQVRGDACALGGAPEFQTRLVVHHFGKMHTGRRKAALDKERAFQELYTELGFPDPKVKMQWEAGDEFDYLKVFDLALQAGHFRPFEGTHPKFVQAWLEERRAEEQSKSGLTHNV